jgi:rhamnogalacturonyl hydrolase YesR
VDLQQTKETKTRAVEKSLLKLHDWVLKNGWSGYDPYDLKHWCMQRFGCLMNVRYVKSLVGLPVLAEGYYPCKVRRLVGVKPLIYPKAMGLFARSYASMYEYFDDGKYLELAQECAQWLHENVSVGYKGYGWGFPIDWQSRIFIPAGTPCGTVSAICGEGFWKLYEVTKDTKYLEICRKICEGFVQDLSIDCLDANTVCFSYTPLDNFHVHNLNLLIAVFLVRVGKHIGENTYLDLGKRAANYALKEQRDDGSLSYWGKDQSIDFHSDHYHSGFEIRALHLLWKLTGGDEYYSAVKRYYNYYLTNFFGEDGAPWRNPGSSRLIDIHGCAEALVCNAQLSDDFSQANEVLLKAADWIISQMQSAEGYFIYRIIFKGRKRRRIDIPYIRWGQAWMMRGLTAALEVLKR